MTQDSKILDNQEIILNEQTDFYARVYKQNRIFDECFTEKSLDGTDVQQIKEDDR